MKPELVSKERIEELALEEWRWDRDHIGGTTFGGYIRTARAVLEELGVVRVIVVDEVWGNKIQPWDLRDGAVLVRAKLGVEEGK